MDRIYIKPNKYTKIDKESVTIGDVASIQCNNSTLVSKIKTQKICSVSSKQTRVAISALKLVEIINGINPNVEVSILGETDFVVVMSGKDKDKVWQLAKAILVWMILFVGSAFAIMSFNNDVSVEKLFAFIYENVTGTASDGFTVIEISYSIGIFIAIVVFYNHLGNKKLSTDPTPMEVEIRNYEADINDTVIDNAERNGENVDV